MHGIVLKGLKDFVVAEYDTGTWRQLQQEAGVDGQLYVPITEYPDEDVLALVETASEMTDTPVPELLDAFGQFLVPSLLETYGVHVDQDWTGLELIVNLETYIHEALRAKQLSTYTPPELDAAWIDEDSVGVTYTSDRELCPLAKGLIRGVGDYYDQPLSIEEQRCMLEDDAECYMVVSRAG